MTTYADAQTEKIPCRKGRDDHSFITDSGRGVAVLPCRYCPAVQDELDGIIYVDQAAFYAARNKERYS